MKEVLLEFLDNWLAVLWFAMGMVFFVFATIAAANVETDRSIACIGVCLACHARSEVHILKRKIEKKENLK